ncbi:MAG: keto-deoxy-phosphogluconate aldolase, partial [Arenicellales bacterium]|nr:keto-deoxy-phosphogluconate aldolase [Arenicellales bacterium]
APLPEISFMPTGGISAATASDYLALDNVRAIGGSWITPPDLLRAGNFSAISRLAKDAASLGL